MVPDPIPTPKSDYADFGDQRIKHLEMIQAVVARLGGNGFLIKGWAVTVAGAFVALAVNAEDCSFARVGIASSVVFWGLDGYFLRAERRFRALGDRVRKFDPKIEPFFMGATANRFVQEFDQRKRWEMSWGGASASWTLMIFYGALVGTGLAASLLV
jgi:hypothetical protein